MTLANDFSSHKRHKLQTVTKKTVLGHKFNAIESHISCSVHTPEKLSNLVLLCPTPLAKLSIISDDRSFIFFYLDDSGLVYRYLLTILCGWLSPDYQQKSSSLFILKFEPPKNTILYVYLFTINLSIFSNIVKSKKK